MDPNQAGITALVTAYARAYHAAHDSPKVFDDFLAYQLFTLQERIFFNQQLSTLLKLIDPALAEQYPDQESALSLVMQLQTGPITLSRSRYCEDELEKTLETGVDQYVILGAGFDTFGFRRLDLKDRLQVYEVDHPVTQGLKRQRIENAKWQIPDHLHFVPVDFSGDDLMESLINSGFDPRKRSFFSWLGVTFYLSDKEIEETLAAISSKAAERSIILFDYLDSDSLIDEKAGRTVKLMKSITMQAGEPIRSSFDPFELGKILDKSGFSLLENLNPSEIENLYFKHRQDQYHAVENVHFAKAISICK